MLGRARGRAPAILLACALLLVAWGSTASGEPSGARAWIEPVLDDRAWLEANGYLSAGDQVSLIVQLHQDRPLVVERPRILAELEQHGHQAHHRLDLAIVDAFSVTAPHDSIHTMSAIPAVKRVWLDHKVSATLQDSVPLINADDVWTHDDGSGVPIKGKNIIVSVIDSGLAYDHIEFGSCSSFSSCPRISGGYDYVNSDNDPYDDHSKSHGTHVSGIIGAKGEKLSGVAPKTNYLIYKVLDFDGSSNESNIIAAIENSTDSGAHVISMSLGKQCFNEECSNGTDPISQAVDAAESKNVVVVVAAGNNGKSVNSEGTLASPATAKGAVTVGATYKQNHSGTHSFFSQCHDIDPRQDQIACFSSRGPTADGRTKPDLVAPGVYIKSTLRPTQLFPEKYGELSGTSMSTPHVSGVVALMRQAYPSWGPEQIKDKLKGSTIIYEGSRSPDEDGRDPDNTYGWGRVDALRALDVGPTATSARLSGTTGENGWFTGPVDVSLSSVDTVDLLGFTTGPRELYWQLDGAPVGGNVTLNGLLPNGALTGAVAVDGDGVHEVVAWGVDNGGNREADRTWTVRIDTQPPATTGTLEPEGNGTRLTLAATDATSGVAETRYSIDDGAWQPYTDPVRLLPGQTARYHSLDIAGLNDEVQSVTLPVPTFTRPRQGHLTVGAGNVTAEHALPPQVNTTGAVTAGTVHFELAVDPLETTLEHVNLTITRTTGEVLHHGPMTLDGTTEGGRLVYTTTWEPPAGPRFGLTARAAVENDQGAFAASMVTLSTLGSTVESTAQRAPG